MCSPIFIAEILCKYIIYRYCTFYTLICKHRVHLLLVSVCHASENLMQQAVYCIRRLLESEGF
jgi:hypothetical protein